MANPNSSPALQALQDELAKELGWKPELMKRGICIRCEKEFRRGNKDDPNANIFTDKGVLESTMSGLCERCWDTWEELMSKED